MLRGMHSAPTEKHEPRAVHPAIYLVLNLPFGVTTGYIIAVLPLQLTASGASVAAAASLVAFSISPKVWKFIWAPLVDLTLTLKVWYVIGAAIAGVMLIACGFAPSSPDRLWLLALCAFLAEVGTGFLTTALAGLMAEAMPDEQKGRTAGWYQLGGKLGHGLGGGAGVWLLVHEHTGSVPAIVLGLTCLVPIYALLLVPKPATMGAVRSLGPRLRQFARDFFGLFTNTRTLFVVVLLLTPIGISGVSNFWSGVASEWGASSNTIALMTGPMAAVASVAGCLLAGWLADRFDRRFVYLGCGAILALVTLALSEAPRLPLSFVTGTFTVSLLLAMGDAAFSALILSVIGVRAAASKYALLSALGNIPDIYMTTFSGFAHDAWGTTRMLQIEAAFTILCIVAAAAWILLFQRDFSGQRTGDLLDH